MRLPGYHHLQEFPLPLQVRLYSCADAGLSPSIPQNRSADQRTISGCQEGPNMFLV